MDNWISLTIVSSLYFTYSMQVSWDRYSVLVWFRWWKNLSNRWSWTSFLSQCTGRRNSHAPIYPRFVRPNKRICIFPVICWKKLGLEIFFFIFLKLNLFRMASWMHFHTWTVTFNSFLRRKRSKAPLRDHFVRPSVHLSVHLSVRLSHFWFADNFFTLRDRAFIFDKCVPYDKTFLVVT